MIDYGKRYQVAESLRKNEQFQEAEAAFRLLWAERPNAGAGWRWIYSLRKLGRSQEALQAAVQVVGIFPEDAWVQREYAWSIYAQEVKTAQAAGDVGRTQHFAQKMLKAADDELVRKQAVFAVIDAAKERGRWEIVSEWCDRLDPQQLSLEQNVFGEQKIMADRERWYYAKVKALISLKRWAEARKFAEEAREFFPHKDDFTRWAAQARAAEGDVAGAVEEIETIARHGNARWYILGDIAQMKMRLGESQEALQAACRAALAPGEDKAKVNLFSLLAELELALGRAECAAHHVALAKSIRLREGWPVREDLIQLERRAHAALTGSTLALPEDLRQLFKYCEKEWRAQVRVGKPRQVGRVCNLPDGKKFGFIAPEGGGENIHVLLRDLPSDARAVGVWVEYSLEPSFDHRKNRESVRAVEVQLAKPDKGRSHGQ